MKQVISAALLGLSCAAAAMAQPAIDPDSPFAALMALKLRS